jgi:excinuclease UvrABC helicase subunit UvrB
VSAADEMADLGELPVDELQRLVIRLEQEMRLAAAELRYEEAALLRDDIAELRLALAEAEGTPGAAVPLPAR